MILEAFLDIFDHFSFILVLNLHGTQFHRACDPCVHCSIIQHDDGMLGVLGHFADSAEFSQRPINVRSLFPCVRLKRLLVTIEMTQRVGVV